MEGIADEAKFRFLLPVVFPEEEVSIWSMYSNSLPPQSADLVLVVYAPENAATHPRCLVKIRSTRPPHRRRLE
jgi:hypothetical protein